MTKPERNDGFPLTEWAIYLDTDPNCRGIDKVDEWVRRWDAVDAPLALWSFGTYTHSYVQQIRITGRTCQWERGTGTARIRAKVHFADPEVGTVGAWLIRAGGVPFVSEDARRFFHN